MSEPGSYGSTAPKPGVFTTGSKVCLQYQSTGETFNCENDIIGFVIQDIESYLVIEEYHKDNRINDHRHILLDTATTDIYSQTNSRTHRVGQAAEARLLAPPWESPYDMTATGVAVLATFNPDFRWIEQGIYTFPDPAILDQPDGWSPDVHRGNPIPDELQNKNAKMAYHPPVDLDL